MHTSTNNIEKPAMLDTCNEFFSNKSDINKQHEAQTKLESCIRDIWSKKCPDKSPLDKYAFAENTEKPLIVDPCSEDFPLKSSLNGQHQAETFTHEVDDKKCSEESQCDVQVDNSNEKMLSDVHKSTLDIHTFTQNMQKPLTFDPCSDDFSFKSGTNGQHQARTFALEVGDKKCFEESQCDLEVDSSNDGKSTNVCSKNLLHENDLNKVNSICAKKSFTCKICSKGFTRKSDLTRHYCIHSKEMPFICEACNKGFYHQGHLIRHIRVHTNETPFVCEVCNKGFSHSGYLKVHLRIHTNEKNFICEVCNKRFLQNSDLIRHARIHTNDKPFVCEICQDGFTRKDHLKRHMGTHS